MRADLRNADLRNANLGNAKNVKMWPACPDTGSFIAWKKCRDNLIVKLEIPADAKRSSATTRKCRASKALVLEIQNIDGTKAAEDTAISGRGLEYKTGEMVYPDKYDENRWNECSNGIHFFINRMEAVNW